MMEDAHDMRSFLTSKLKKKIDEKREEEQEENTDEARVLKVAKKIAATKSPPGYAKALFKAHQRAKKFANAVIKRVKSGDPDLIFRFLCWEGLLTEFANELPQNIRDAANPNVKAMAEFPFSVFAEILGEEYRAPQDGENFPPLARAEQPIHWDD